jgi:hypothetical protein
MANKLLAKRGAQLVGIRWPYNFVKRIEILITLLTFFYLI